MQQIFAMGVGVGRASVCKTEVLAEKNGNFSFVGGDGGGVGQSATTSLSNLKVGTFHIQNGEGVDR